MSKRTFDGFFKSSPAQKEESENQPQDQHPEDRSSRSSNHPTYPWPVPYLPTSVGSEVETLVLSQGKEINNQPHLDLLYFQPFIPRNIEHKLFEFLRGELFFYRVEYKIQRFGKETQIRTPRFTTVFGIDDTSSFSNESAFCIVEASGSGKGKPVSKTKYKCQPRPIPECLDLLRRVTEAATNSQYNICLVNYYATGDDSISYHSDDERFLGPDPTIASFSLGAKRDFLMKHKPTPPPSTAKCSRSPTTPAINPHTTPRTTSTSIPISTSTSASSSSAATTPLKFQLASGDMLLMRGPTQSHWLHSIPKRKDGGAGGGPGGVRGRINITLRRARVPAGTENYYQYNVGKGEVWKWDNATRKMLPWKGSMA